MGNHFGLHVFVSCRWQWRGFELKDDGFEPQERETHWQVNTLHSGGSDSIPVYWASFRLFLPSAEPLLSLPLSLSQRFIAFDRGRFFTLFPFVPLKPWNVGHGRNAVFESTMVYSSLLERLLQWKPDWMQKNRECGQINGIQYPLC